MNKPTPVVEPCGRIHGTRVNVGVKVSMRLRIDLNSFHKALFKPKTSFRGYAIDLNLFKVYKGNSVKVGEASVSATWWFGRWRLWWR